MNLFDTNIFELFLAGNPNIIRRFTEHYGAVWLSSVAAEERLTGYLSSLNRARATRTVLSLPRAHEDFTEALKTINAIPVLPYSEEAEQIYRTFSAAQRRIGAQDCRIAAQAMAHGLTVITRNTSDFQAIGAPCADWSL